MYVGSLIETTNEYILAEMAIDEYLNGNSSLLEAYANGSINFLIETVSREEKDRRRRATYEEIKRRNNGKLPSSPDRSERLYEGPHKHWFYRHNVNHDANAQDRSKESDRYYHRTLHDIINKNSGKYTSFAGYDHEVPSLGTLVRDKQQQGHLSDRKIQDFKDIYIVKDQRKWKENVKAEKETKAKMEETLKKAESQPKPVIYRMISSLRNLYKKWLNKQNRAKANGENIGTFKNICRIILNCIDKLMKKIRISVVSPTISDTSF